jgi:NAD(P)-dependent dehydrogenase (short-subunit alcohol dehydrogenase family)
MRPQGSGQVKELAGRAALVTGGAVRVGRAIALTLAAAGCDVAIGYRRSAAAARATVREIGALGVRAVACPADLGRPAEAARLARQAARRLGRLDIVVNNAAIFARTPFATTTAAEFDRMIAVNLRGPFFVAQAAARIMGRRGGRIINVVDVAATRAWPGYLPYAISKAGLVLLTRGLAVALAPAVQVNAVGPGVVLFPEGFPKAQRRALVRRIPMEREGSPGDVAAAVAFFATCPEYITGQVLYIDGGTTAAGGA